MEIEVCANTSGAGSTSVQGLTERLVRAFAVTGAWACGQHKPAKWVAVRAGLTVKMMDGRGTQVEKHTWPQMALGWEVGC